MSADFVVLKSIFFSQAVIERDNINTIIKRFIV
jgi:hypothetical protein